MIPYALIYSIGTATMASVSSTTAGGTKLTLKALLAAALSTVTPHATRGATATTGNTLNSLVGTPTTP